MNPETGAALIQAGAISVMALSAVGSGLGAGTAGSAAVGAWKRCYIQKKPAPFQLVVFVGAPLSQTIYGMIVMLLMNGKAQNVIAAAQAATAAAAQNSSDATSLLATATAMAANWPFFFVGGIVAGIGMGISAWMQGVASAGCCDAFAETNTGFTNNLTILGIVETVALFVMVFTIIMLLSIH
jgi:V/A-type H+-transporting ATPase subunit K